MVIAQGNLEIECPPYVQGDRPTPGMFRQVGSKFLNRSDLAGSMRKPCINFAQVGRAPEVRPGKGFLAKVRPIIFTGSRMEGPPLFFRLAPKVRPSWVRS